MTPALDDDLGDLLGRDGITAWYQPIVELGSGELIGYEALARGPVGSPLHEAADLFSAAAAAGRDLELDWACQTAALAGALGSLDRQHALFMNVGAATRGVEPPLALQGAFVDACRRFRIVLEISERSVLEQPAELLRAVAQARELGAAVAIDDIGVNVDSLALMPFVKPEVLKLDLGIVQGRPQRSVVQLIRAIQAQAERTGAVIVAEGIETEEHLEQAVAFGATFGQGWLFGRPAPLPTTARQADVRLVSHLPRWTSTVASRSPFEIVSSRVPSRVCRKDLLVPLAAELEELAGRLATAPVVLSSFQDADWFGPVVAERYAELAERAFVGVVPPGTLDEWVVVVLSAMFSGVIVARDLGDGGPDGRRRFEYAVSHDRDLVVDAGAALLQLGVASVSPHGGTRARHRPDPA